MDDGLLTHYKQVCVLGCKALRKEIMDEAHQSLYVVHLRNTKMYKDLKGSYWWKNRKGDIAKYVEHCPYLLASESGTSKIRKNT
jgi:hypothetical protein